MNQCIFKAYSCNTATTNLIGAQAQKIRYLISKRASFYFKIYQNYRYGIESVPRTVCQACNIHCVSTVYQPCVDRGTVF